jgi:L-ascorbate metabolism protein UlaG (beta-lactamase superfamily)
MSTNRKPWSKSVPEIQIHGDCYTYGQTTGSRICAHQGGKMIPDGDCLRCPVHGWVKHAATGEYTNGHRDAVFGRPWEIGSSGVFQVRMIAHACVEITMGDFVLLTDPWLTGTAFNGGWLLTDVPPVIRTPDAIWYSHAHSDHASRDSAWAADGHRFTAEHVSDAVSKAIGLPVAGWPANEWLPLGPARAMILLDATSKTDTGLLIEYLGKRVLLIVDCPNLNGGRLPKCDLAFAAYAGGASGYPVCWHMEPSRRDQLTKASRVQMLQRLLWLRDTTGAKVIPYAGSFIERDPAIRAINRHNSLEDAWNALGYSDPLPIPGTTYDVLTRQRAEPAPQTIDWERWLAHFQGDYRTDAVMHVIDTDGRSWWLDFAAKAVTSKAPQTASDSRQFYAMTMTTPGVLATVINSLQPLDEISIGFHARFRRSPDVYDAKFWERFGKGLRTNNPD